MKRLIVTTFLLLGAFAASAIKPSRIYANTPEKMGLSFEEIRIKTKDGPEINIWHLPSDNALPPVIISQSDAGNMGDWLYLGAYLQAYGLDVWMYDYRGFGESGDFPIVNTLLFHSEFVSDLAAVVDYVYDKTAAVPVLMGLSMGTIIVKEYLRSCDYPIRLLIFDGYVHDPEKWVERLSQEGKVVSLPAGFKRYRGRNGKAKALYIVSEKDRFSLLADIPKISPRKRTIKTFASGHISSFALFPQEYAQTIQSFISETVLK